MKSIVTTLNNLIPNQTAQSVLRYAFTLLGAWLAGKGVAGNLVALITGGALLTLIAGILGAANELYADGGTWKQFWFSIIRKAIAFAGTFVIAGGWADTNTVAQASALVLAITGPLLGVTDEAVAQAKAEA